MSSDQMPAPGKTKLIKFPPSQAGKDSKCPGYALGGGGMFKLWFDTKTCKELQKSEHEMYEIARGPLSPSFDPVFFK